LSLFLSAAVPNLDMVEGVDNEKVGNQQQVMFLLLFI